MSRGNNRIVRSFRREGVGFWWDEVDVHPYNAPGTISNRIAKQILFHADENLCSELRYFEALPGGWSALERHDHVHAVLILRGCGRILVGEEIYPIQEHDIVYIPPQTWHQLYAHEDEALGFLCLVNGDRDRPTRPDEAERDELMKNPDLKDVIRF